MEYEPYGKEWQSMLKRISFNKLFEMFGVARDKENKIDYILKIKEELIAMLAERSKSDE